MSRAVRRERFWSLSIPAAHTHAFIIAIVLWSLAFVLVFDSVKRGKRFGDFVFFYTIGGLAAARDAATLYSYAAFHAAQVQALPVSADALYPPVYPPQVPVLMAPLSRLTYGNAATVWAFVTVVLYALCVWLAWRPVRQWLRPPSLVALAALAFPPFWHMVIHGQVTMLIVGAFCCGWMALERDRRVLAGLAFGLLASKPQFGMLLAVIVLVERDWRMLAGALASVVTQVAAVWLVFGRAAFDGFGAMLPWMVSHADALEALPHKSHSIRALTRLFPSAVGVPLWGLLSGTALWFMVRAWVSPAPLRVRFGILILTSVLVNPHLIVYDATVLIFPLLWFGAWVVETGTASEMRRYWTTMYAIVLTLLLPTAAFIGLQLSVGVLFGLLAWSARRTLRSSGHVHELAVPSEG